MAGETDRCPWADMHRIGKHVGCDGRVASQIDQLAAICFQVGLQVRVVGPHLLPRIIVSIRPRTFPGPNETEWVMTGARQREDMRQEAFPHSLPKWLVPFARDDRLVRTQLWNIEDRVCVPLELPRRVALDRDQSPHSCINLLL